MKDSLLNQKNTFFLILFYLLSITFGLFIFQDYGVHIEEKFHRLNGHYWLNYVAKVFNLNEIQLITQSKIDKIYDYTLSPVTYYNKWGVIFDVPVAFLEIILNIEDVNKIYYLKHFLSFLVFLLGSFFFFKILYNRFNNFNLAVIGLFFYLTTPRIFGDSFFYKDILFLSFFSIMIFFLLKSVKNLNYINLINFSLFSAFCFNLKVFSIFIPFIFALILVIQNFKDKKNFYFFKKYFFYLSFFLFFTYIFWPFLWKNPINNFTELFLLVKKDLIKVRILYFNEYIQNFLLPSSYLFNWIFVSSPIFQNLMFLFGFLCCAYRVGNRLLKIDTNMIYNDLWRGGKEKIDFIIFFIIVFFCTVFIVFNAPFYNGWRLVYFFNFFIIYYAIYFINYLFIFLKNKTNLKKLFIFMIILAMFYNFFILIIFHPFQSIYFNNFLSKKFVNGFEGDYYGISTKHFFKKILEINDKDTIYIAVASHTPIQRGLEAFSSEVQEKFVIVGQEYNQADYIYKNNISEVNIELNNKYNIPKNFIKIYEFRINKVIIYEIYKKN